MLMPVSYNYLIKYECEIQLAFHLMIKKNQLTMSGRSSLTQSHEGECLQK